MGNFDFVRETLPPFHDDAAKAESYLSNDPRSACFYSRRTIENLMGYLYQVMNLREPYRSDLAARIKDAQFTRLVSPQVCQKLDLIRRIGNEAVHDSKPIVPTKALTSLRELHHVLIWASFHFSAKPELVPLRDQFDPKLAAQAAPLSHEEVICLAEKFQKQDAVHARELAAKDELLAQSEAEIASLQAQIQAAQIASTASDVHDYGEADTRRDLIDLALSEAGWALDQPRDREYRVHDMPTRTGTGRADYVLWGANGLPLAVVEAKATTSSAQAGQHQAKLYADGLESEFGRRPVIFYTNGFEIWMWDDSAGYPPRQIQGFYTRDELELAIQRRNTRQQLSHAEVSTDIAGRPYQVRALKAVGDAFDRRQRDALLVMATGSGKTRTVIALVEQLQRAGWVKRVLFLADRTALVAQATAAFKEHLPASTTVNLVREKSLEGRVYVSTYPTMMNLINEVDGGERRFGAGYFDLIVIDEAHRSVYAKYGAIFEYFDALLVGLTATPKDEIDHNTYRLFNLENGVPTDAYGLDEAVADGYLVPPRGVSVGTEFLDRGIRYDALSDEEKAEWDAIEWGEEGPPEAVDAGVLNTYLFNEDTVDKVLSTLMLEGYKVAGGDRLGKTIIFAKNQAHAEFIQRRFDAAYPEYAGQFAQIITHQSRYAQNLIDNFSQSEKTPHIAISVDMLDTGIDVPEVVNLVFFKAVHSKSKFWQMIGRGTRLCPDLFGPGEDKQDFLVFDFCGNLEFFSQDIPGREGTTQKSLSQRLFEMRLLLLRELDLNGGYVVGGASNPTEVHSVPRAADGVENAVEHTKERGLRESTVSTLREIIAGMNPDNFIVRPHRREIERFSRPQAWRNLSEDDIEMAQALAGLPSATRDDDEAAKRFDLLILSAQLAQMEGNVTEVDRVGKKVQNIASSLLTRTTIPAVAAQAELLEEVNADSWWMDVTLPMMEELRQRVRSLVRFLDRSARSVVYTDFEDSLREVRKIDLPSVTPGMNSERFRAKVEACFRDHHDNLALQRLRRNRQLTNGDLSELERLLLATGVAQSEDIERVADRAGGLGLFIRSIVGLDREAAEREFEQFLDRTRFSVDQVRFVGLIINELTKNGMVEPRRLFESPYTDEALRGPDQMFGEAEFGKIVGTLRSIKQTAVPR
ncbi:DEAD/DEAH box helicase family protein [Actinomycetaceae bacterium L2_0104]